MPPRRMRPDEMLDAIRVFQVREGGEPTRLDFEKPGNGLPSRQIIEREFRQWQLAVEASRRTAQPI